MKKIQLLITLIAAICINVGYNKSYAGSTYYSKGTVKSSNSGQGTVYLSTLRNHDPKYAASLSASQGESFTTHKYYLCASAGPGYNFEKWMNGDTQISSYPVTTVTIKASSDSKNSPTTQEYTAYFVPCALKVVADNYLGTVAIDNPANSIGDKVKVSCTLVNGSFTSEFMSGGTTASPSKSVKFEGWYNSAGEKVSDALSFEYTVTKEEVLTAKFTRENTIKINDDGNIHGYYRLASPIYEDGKNYIGPNFLTLTGDFKVSFSEKDRSLEGALEFDAYPENHANRAKSGVVYGEPGNIWYLTGKPSNQIYTITPNVDVATNINAIAQGVSTHDLAGSYFTVKTSNTPGYYYLKGGSVMGTDVTLQLTYSRKLWVSGDKLDNPSYEISQDFDVQPVDREHIDTFYFGANADATMQYDDGYWATMYTAFPYECYEADGVEAYVAKSTYDDKKDGLCVVLTKIENGVVPAETPVVLKCKGTTPKENRLIPLETDDARIAESKEECEGNILTGSYSLWTGARTGRPKYDKNTMRVFSVNNSGVVGFYRLGDNADGTAPDLVPNRAYLEDSKLAELAGSNKSIRFVFAKDIEQSGLESVAVEQQPVEETIYDLYGRRVSSMIPGNIYVVNGKKVLYR